MCEGYTDVIGFFEAGVERAVATCGTALAEEHVKLLRGFASRVVLAFDADSAGQSAAGRFYEWERRLEVDVAVAALPPGSDPGDMARTDPDGLRAAVEGAKPFLQFRVERILDAADLSTPEGRAKAADTALGGGGRAPRQPGPRPVPDAGGRAVPARAPAAARPARAAAPGRAAPPSGHRRARTGPGPRPPDRGAPRRPATGANRGSGSPRTATGTPTDSTGGGSSRAAPTAGGRPRIERGHRAAPAGPGVPPRPRGPAPGHPPARRCRPPAGGGPVPRRPPAGGLPGPGRRRPRGRAPPGHRVGSTRGQGPAGAPDRGGAHGRAGRRGPPVGPGRGPWGTAGDHGRGPDLPRGGGRRPPLPPPGSRSWTILPPRSRRRPGW